MRLGIIIPTEEQKTQAGVRIRYERIKPALQLLGHDLDFIPIQGLASTSKPTHAIYLISKCYDARAILAAQRLHSLGAYVGVDLFDDNFSQLTDSRFVRLRYWLRTLLPHCSFILCSTPGMQDVASAYGPALPTHVMNDTAEPFDAETLAKTLVLKLDRAQQLRRIDVAWFGMGDNPNFPVGLADLAAYGSDIDRLRGHGFDIHLSILTNQRSMTADNLAPLRKLATAFAIEEWTVEREAALLARSLVSFLPVNAQSFSRVKSLNRALTALTAGTQVLSSGYPLYQPLEQFIYRCPRQLTADLKQGELLMRPATVRPFCERTHPLADIETETKKLMDFLSGMQSPQRLPGQSNASFAVIHGQETLGDTHKFAQKQNVLSVASPLCKLDLNFDVRFRYNQHGGLMVLVNKKKSSLIDTRLIPKLDPPTKVLSTDYLVIDVSTVFPDIATPGHSLIQLESPATNAAAYPVIMGYVIEILYRIFPGLGSVMSEQSKRLPWALPMKSAFEVVQ
ncbi:hypothetical protein [Polaromonas eurypsychrophila]|uniref:Uncharacterized protein n=1 Tax=Polaromonas eurypsychrophila TaxID=1614635 RepID=A0A916SNZ2_9BURK|nr:hypothetical protein [Polaromonas eurypsychrophila]GGB09610.1 hypothetical protein GCM10011496_33150 [Polaromonas eurypsychrophila]